ncbi:hypothetical protein [Helicobacter canis]|nr:hypothetical protein [Helicobacter canis]
MVAHSQIISVALLHHRCSLESLEKLYRALKDRFAYFEIVLLNPVLEPKAPNEQKLDSSMDSKETSATPKQYPLFSKEATLCHASTSALARNDRKVDSRRTCSRWDLGDKNGAYSFIFSAQDSKIAGLESGLFKACKEDKTSGLSTPQGAEIHDSSLQAESLNIAPPPPATSITHTIPNCRVLQVRSMAGDYKNLGALSYEIFLRHCIGDYVLFMDLQSDPLDVALAILESCHNYDITIASRTRKPYGFVQAYASRLFYKILRMFSDGEYREELSEFCVLSRKAINVLLRTQDDIKLLRFIDFDSTLKICEHPYTPTKIPRKSLLDHINLGLDMIFGRSYKLLRLGTCLCLAFAVFNGVYGIYIAISFYFMPHITQGWTSTSAYMVLSNIGLFSMLSIIGEYMRIILLKQKGAAYEIIDEQSSVVLDYTETNIKDS